MQAAVPRRRIHAAVSTPWYPSRSIQAAVSEPLSRVTGHWPRFRSSFIPHPPSLLLPPMATIRTGSIAAHAHWAPDAYTSYLAKFGRQAGTTQSPLMADLPARMKWMDERNVGMHVLTLSGGMPWQWAPHDAANDLARIVN